MTESLPRNQIERAAADWFVKLQGDPALEEWTAFQTWLEADPEHAAAYDAVEALWVGLDNLAGAIPQVAPSTTNLVPLRLRRRVPRRGLLMGLGMAAAASIAVWAVTPQLTGPSYTDYATKRGETRKVALSDGSRLTLGSATILRVRLGRQQRDAILVDGEASFDIAHLENRPFVVTVGAREVRVLGTEFNILSHSGRLAVSVRRGRVAVSGGQEGRVELVRGQQLVQSPGGSAQKRDVAPDTAFAWASGKLIYDRTPLTEVVADLNRYVATPIRVDPSAASVTVSGVLLLDEEASMIRRLELFAPITAQTTPSGILLKAKTARR